MIINDLQYKMLRIRLVEESIANRYSEQNMRCPTHLSIGQEAISVGVCENLTNKDLVLSTHRAHAHYLAKGGDLKAMIAEIYGKRTGCSKGMGGSMHLIDLSVGFMGSTAIVGNTIPVAAGLALSLKLQKSDAISCVFFGDGACEEGAFYESLNFSALHNLPILYICENNLYSVYSGLEVRQPPKREIHEMVNKIGVNSSKGNGNNISEVVEKVAKAKQRILDGKGPQFLEFETYRWREHCGPNFDNDLGYRSKEEFLAWKDKDPLRDIYEKSINDNSLTYMQEINTEINDAHDFALSSEYPNFDDYNQSFEGI